MHDPSANVAAAAADHQTAHDLAQRFAPILVLWPEIPAEPHAPDSIRERYARQRHRSSSQPTSGAHIARDFHPRDVRLILDHAQAWEPRSPLPLVPVGFMRLYRDFAKFFIWPIAGAILFVLLVVALSQDLNERARDGVEIGGLALLAAIYLLTLRSPILTPVDNWHHLNHMVAASGLAVVWFLALGAGEPWWVGLIIAAPSAALLLTSLIVSRIEGFASSVVFPVRWFRSFILWSLNRRAHLRPRLRDGTVFRGLKPPHEYTDEAELFFRFPRRSRQIHRSDRGSFWSAYSRILSEQGARYPLTCYARVLEPNEQGLTAIQYWYCFYYDDWANQHETDWETAMVLLRGTTPVAMAASAHEGGELRDWDHIEVQDGRPLVYVAAGSHAFYFKPGPYLAERAIAGLRFTSIDAALFGREILDFVDFTAGPMERLTADSLRVIHIPDPDPETGLWGHEPHDDDCRGDCEFNFEWLNYDGHWGTVGLSLTGGFSGPRGPTASGLIWDNPYLWADTVCRPCAECDGGASPRGASPRGAA
jgi:hypothetical protein